MNGTDLYMAQKKFMVKRLRIWLNVKIERHKVKKEERKEKIIDIFNSKDALTVANFFSYLRIVFAGLIIMALDSSNNYLITTLFTLGLITDWLDGIFADVYEEVTEIGKIIDPTADKFLIFGALWPFIGIITWTSTPDQYLPQPIIILMSIDFILMLTAFIKPWINRNTNLFFGTGATIFGKAKMILESISVYAILFLDLNAPTDKLIILYLLSASIFMAILSLISHWIPKTGSA